MIGRRTRRRKERTRGRREWILTRCSCCSRLGKQFQCLAAKERKRLGLSERCGGRVLAGRLHGWRCECLDWIVRGKESWRGRGRGGGGGRGGGVNGGGCECLDWIVGGKESWGGRGRGERKLVTRWGE